MRPPDDLRFYHGIFWGAHYLPHAAGSGNFCFLGAPGSGKTISIRLLLQTALPLIGVHREDIDHRALVYDPKDDMIPYLRGMEGVGCEIKNLNPFHKDGVAWDIAKDINDRAGAKEIAAILVPAEQNTKDPFFDNAVRNILEGVVLSFILTAGESWTFRDVMYAMSSSEGVKEVLSRTRETRALISQFFSSKKLTDNVMATVATKLMNYKIVAALWSRAKEKISLTDWILTPKKRGKPNYIIVIGTNEIAREAIDSINRVIFKRASQLILQLRDEVPGTEDREIVRNTYVSDTSLQKRRHWIVLDEVSGAGPLENLELLLRKGRSKGAATVLGLQDTDGLRGTYGKEKAGEILGMCRSYAFFQILSPETTAWVSQFLGESEVLEQYIGVSRNRGSSSTSQKEFWYWDEKSYTENESVTEDEKLSYRLIKEVLPSQLTYMKPASRENGLEGWYFSSFAPIPLYHVTMPGNFVFSPRILNTPAPYEVEKRGGAEQELEPWDNDDLNRLWPGEETINLEIEKELDKHREEARKLEGAISKLEELAKFRELRADEKEALEALKAKRFKKAEKEEKGDGAAAPPKEEEPNPFRARIISVTRKKD